MSINRKDLTGYSSKLPHDKYKEYYSLFLSFFDVPGDWFKGPF